MGRKQGFERVRERTEHGPKTVELVPGLTRLSPQRADATRLRERIRGHWGIEPKRHDKRAGTLGEDASRVRKGAAPHVRAA